MPEFLQTWIPNLIELYPDLLEALGETLYMVFFAGIFSALAGIPIGVTLVITRPGHIHENRWLYGTLGKIVNIFRSIPFIILLTAIIPVTRFIMGTTIGTNGALVPLIFGATPFVARQIESALLDVDRGVIEAAQAMGSSSFEIIWRVLLREGLPGIISGLTITAISLIGFSAMAGTVGGGGLGDFAIRWGYQYFKTDIMVGTIIVLLVLVNLIQRIGEILVKRLSH